MRLLRRVGCVALVFGLAGCFSSGGGGSGESPLQEGDPNNQEGGGLSGAPGGGAGGSGGAANTGMGGTQLPLEPGPAGGGGAAPVVCGDGIISDGETCEPAVDARPLNLGGADCEALGLPAGMLLCDATSCTYDTQLCGMPDPGGGGTGGGAGTSG